MSTGMTRRVGNTANRVGTQNRENLWHNATNSAQTHLILTRPRALVRVWRKQQKNVTECD